MGGQWQGAVEYPETLTVVANNLSSHCSSQSFLIALLTRTLASYHFNTIEEDELS